MRGGGCEGVRVELEGAKVEEWRVWGLRACRVEGGGVESVGVESVQVEGGRVESVGVESVQGGRWKSGECGGRERAGWKVEEWRVRDGV